MGGGVCAPRTKMGNLRATWIDAKRFNRWHPVREQSRLSPILQRREASFSGK